MFNVWLDYPSYKEEIEVVRQTTTERSIQPEKVLGAEDILFIQELVRRVPVPENVLEYAVKLASKTRPNTENATPDVNRLLSWGAGPRASQYLVLGAKCHAVVSGKYSPDIEDVRAVAAPILRHRIVRNYKAEAEGVSVESIIKGLL
jgi:MoxR-like ATPase